jgi:hypothetical protein
MIAALWNCTLNLITMTTLCMSHTPEGGILTHTSAADPGEAGEFAAWVASTTPEERRSRYIQQARLFTNPLGQTVVSFRYDLRPQPTETYYGSTR